MNLEHYTAGDFQRGRPAWVELVWLIVQGLFIDCWLPGSRHRVWLLRCFGARIGRGAVIKPHVRIKFPWRLVMADHVWIGEGVWLDNLAEIRIGSHCNLSQGVYVCTGSHDAFRDSFDLQTRSVVLADQVWLGAFSRVAPGVHLAEGSLLQMGSVLTRSTEPQGIYAGIPARRVKERAAA